MEVALKSPRSLLWHDPLFLNQRLLCSVGLVVLLCLLGSEWDLDTVEYWA